MCQPTCSMESLNKLCHALPASFNTLCHNVPYSAKHWRGKTLANRSFQSFGEENVGEFTIATISYYSESGILVG